MDLAAIIRIAQQAHAGQLDKQGRDYVDAHLVPIARGVAALADAVSVNTGQQSPADSGVPGIADSTALVAAAWLHDILEDTDVTAADLAAQGVDPAVIAAVESVTRTPGESYDDLITRSCAHPLGRYVKLVDNAWNLTVNPEFARIDAAKAKQLRDERYLPARARLLAATGLSGRSPELWALQEILTQEATRLRSAS